MPTSADTYDVIIAGGGPAGSSASIHLANSNVRVLLVEQKQFPRAKLCGEFISPECRGHFHRLGIAEKMMSSNPASLTETVFYSRRTQPDTAQSVVRGRQGARIEPRRDG